MARNSKPDKGAWESELAARGVAHGEGLGAHRAALAALLQALAGDAGVLGVRLGGSLARGGGDALSDLDVVVEVHPDHFGAVWSDREALARIAGDVVLALEHQWGPPVQEACYAAVYADGLYLDLVFRRVFRQGSRPEPAGDVVLWRRADIPDHPSGPPSSEEPLPILVDPLEDTFALFWCGSLLCAKHLVRKDLWNALWFVQSRRDLFLRAWRLAHSSEHLEWGWHSVRQDLPAWLMDRLAHAVPRLDQEELARALLAMTDLMDEAGPDLARVTGVAYPLEGARAIGRIVRSLVHAPKPGA